jgi:hypothetical protein
MVPDRGRTVSPFAAVRHPHYRTAGLPQVPSWPVVALGLLCWSLMDGCNDLAACSCSGLGSP